MSQFYSLKVTEVKPITPESVSVSLEIPADLEEQFSFMPGQFVMVEKVINGENLRRYYSIYNTPGENVIKLGIKLKGKDGFADYAMHSLQKGDTLQVSTPMNDVAFDFSKSSQKIMAITIGSGITPFYSYIQYMMQHHFQHYFVLVFGDENPEKTMFYSELQEYARTSPGNFKMYNIFSKDDSGDYRGRINADILQDILQKEGAGFDAVYMIGPDDLKKTLVQVLADSGIDEAKLHYRIYS